MDFKRSQEISKTLHEGFDAVIIKVGFIPGGAMEAVASVVVVTNDRAVAVAVVAVRAVVRL